MTWRGGRIGNLGALRGERGNCAEQSQFAVGEFGGKVSCEKGLGEKHAILARQKQSQFESVEFQVWVEPENVGKDLRHFAGRCSPRNGSLG
jgi:hypothetical protein